MECEYDPESDALMIIFKDEDPEFGEQSGPIINHYNEDEELVEVEILDASETVLDFLEPILSSKRKKIKT